MTYFCIGVGRAKCVGKVVIFTLNLPTTTSRHDSWEPALDLIQSNVKARLQE